MLDIQSVESSLDLGTYTIIIKGIGEFKPSLSKQQADAVVYWLQMGGLRELVEEFYEEPHCLEHMYHLCTEEE